MWFNILMKIQFNPIKFGTNEVTYPKGNHKINDLMENNALKRRIEFDELGRVIDAKWFDDKLDITDHLQKDYFETPNEKGHIETFKNKFQEYIRKSYTKFEQGCKHVIDDFKSKSNPEHSYINEFVYDIQNRLIKIIHNGKEMLIETGTKV